MQVKVKHLIRFLEALNPEMDVKLDKDGWMEDDCDTPEDEMCVLRARGIFQISEWGDTLFISN